MKKYSIEYLKLAEDDLTEIFDYIAQDSPASALDLLDRIDESVAQLEEFPFKGEVPNDLRLRNLNYRMLVVENYLIFYIVLDDSVEIRRVLQGRRNYGFLLS